MSANPWGWVAPWLVFAVAYAAVAVALARHGAWRASLALWVVTATSLAALFATAMARSVPADVMPWPRLLAAALFVLGTPTGAATAAALGLSARRADPPRLLTHVIAAAAAAVVGWALGAAAAVRLLGLVYAVQ